MQPEWILTALIMAVLGGAVALWVRARVRRFWMMRRFRRGRVGEARAVKLLERHGFQVLEDQLSLETQFWVDGQRRTFTVRADYLAERRGKVFVVEVKTGRRATDPASSATRRQLLEYSHVYDADGLLLADMEADRLHEIHFDHNSLLSGGAARGAPPWLAAAAGFLCGLGLGVWLGWSMPYGDAGSTAEMQTDNRPSAIMRVTDAAP